MTRSPIRHNIRDRQMRRLNRLTTPIDVGQLAQPAIVLAPHPDDETLGCGGLVALKRDRSVPVDIVFMTDGAGSHAGSGAAKLAEERQLEATCAAQVLGVDQNCLHFLGIPDGQLSGAMHSAADQICRIIERTAATQLIVPHPLEPPLDHRATFEAAVGAIGRFGMPVHTLLYPVWLWDQWPWTNPLAPPRERSSSRQIIATAVRDRLGTRVARRLTTRVDISSALARKREALSCHVSQMERPVGRPDWLTLEDVCHGEWLDLLVQSREYYTSICLAPSEDRN